jgi:DHA1 family multidrug resistance protein-like MFS transporter/DHA1 family quinolone resistance protein-like MFS transporter
MVNLAVVYHLRERFSLSAQMIGIGSSMVTITYFIACIALGGLYKRLKPKLWVELSLVGMGVSILGLLFSYRVWQAFTVLGLYGVFMAMLWPPLETWLFAGKEKQELTTTTGAFNFSWSLGSGLSPLLAGILLESSTELPLITGVVLFFTLFVFLYIATIVVPHMREVKTGSPGEDLENLDDRSTPLRYLCWAGVVTVYVAMSVIQTIFPLYAEDVLRISESRVGILLLIRGFSTCLMFVYLGRSTWWQFRKGVILTIQALCAAICLAGVWISSLYAYAAFFLFFGVLYAMVYTMSIFHGASGSVDRSRRMVIHEVLLTVGSIAGATFGGTIYQYYDFDQVLIFCFVLIMVPVVFSLLKSVFKGNTVIVR